MNRMIPSIYQGKPVMLQLFLLYVRGFLRLRLMWCNPLVFMVLVLMLFRLVLGLDWPQFVWISPAVMWLSVLLVLVFSHESSMQACASLGVWYAQFLSPHSTAGLLWLRQAAYWLVTCGPIVMCSPLLGLSLGMTWVSAGALWISLVLGTVILMVLASIISFITLGSQLNGVILALLLLPLMLPVLLLAVGAVINAGMGLAFWPLLLLLLAVAMMAVVFAPGLFAFSLGCGLDYD